MADAAAQRLSEASLKKYRVLLINKQLTEEDRARFSPSLLTFCAEAGIQFTTQITLPVLTRFRGQWKDGAISGTKKLERLRAFGRFLVDRGWWKENLALKLRRPKVKEAPTMPYTHKEMASLLFACERYIDWRGHAGQDNARRLRAFVLFARYSALRISDAASCAVDRLSGIACSCTRKRPGCRCTYRCRHSSSRRSKRALASVNFIGSGPASVRKRHSPVTGAARSDANARSPA
jgi:site-specific recombinase XerD